MNSCWDSSYLTCCFKAYAFPSDVAGYWGLISAQRKHFKRSWNQSYYWSRKHNNNHTLAKQPQYTGLSFSPSSLCLHAFVTSLFCIVASSSSVTSCSSTCCVYLFSTTSIFLNKSNHRNLSTPKVYKPHLFTSSSHSCGHTRTTLIGSVTCHIDLKKKICSLIICQLLFKKLIVEQLFTPPCITCLNYLACMGKHLTFHFASVCATLQH